MLRRAGVAEVGSTPNSTGSVRSNISSCCSWNPSSALECSGFSSSTNRHHQRVSGQPLCSQSHLFLFGSRGTLFLSALLVRVERFSWKLYKMKCKISCLKNTYSSPTSVFSRWLVVVKNSSAQDLICQLVNIVFERSTVCHWGVFLDINYCWTLPVRISSEQAIQ